MNSGVIKRKDLRDVYPQFSKSKYHSAAKRVRRQMRNGQEPSVEDAEIIENWRASHRHVLNTWQVILKKRCGDEDIVFAQRLKRKHTIYDKLLREESMSLIRMHDIAGCRLIFKNMNSMILYINKLRTAKKLKHINSCEHNYIFYPHPTNSGYRGIHEEYTYLSRKANDRSELWNGLFLEIQFRTIYQHAWATAVEVADMLTGVHVKFNQASESQKEFFRLASEIIARVYEAQHSCYPNYSNEKLADEFQRIESETGLLMRLNQMKLKAKSSIWKKCTILQFKINKTNDPDLIVHPFDSFADANKRYVELEKKYPGDDIVLVKTSDNSIDKSIKDAFRNYFADTKDFVEYIETGIKHLRGESIITPDPATVPLTPLVRQQELDLQIL